MSYDLNKTKGWMPVTLYELHPGLGEWGKAVMADRGFDDSLEPYEICRAIGLMLPARPDDEDHIFYEGVDYIVHRVTWKPLPAAPRYYECVVHATYNGKVPDGST